MASLIQLHPGPRCRQDLVERSRPACTYSSDPRTLSSQRVVFDNDVRAAVSRSIDSSATAAAAARQRLLGTPVCLFGGLFGRDETKAVPTQGSPKFQYHACAPPFSEALVGETFLAGKELRCCYKASVDGFGALQFHERCDFKGPCVIVGTTDRGLTFGAFNPEGYRSTDDYYDTFDAFLFYWPLSEPESSAPIVLKKVGGSGAALFDYARGGPQFGADGLLIGPPLAPVMGGFSGPDTNSGVGQLSDARSRLGLSYAKRPDGKDSLFGDDRRASLVEIEVFCCPAIADLY